MLADKPRALVFGASNSGRAFVETHCDQFELTAFVDNDPEKLGTTVGGIPVVSPEEIGHADFDVVVVASIFFLSIQGQLIGLGVPVEKIDDVSLRLGRVLRASREHLPAHFDALLLDALRSASSARGHSGGAASQLAEQTRALDAGRLDAGTWLAMRYALMIHGFAEASEAARAHAITSALSAATSDAGVRDPHILMGALRASIDTGDLESARGWRSLLEAEPSDEEALHFIDRYLSMCGSGAVSAEQAESENEVFRTLVKGRSVAVVGPAPCGAGQGREIESFDLFVRVSYWGADHLPDPLTAGSRTDISYYNEQHGLRVVQPENIDLLKDLRYVVFKDPAQAREFTASRAAILPGPILFDGHPNMIPLILFDLLHFDPARLKVFGTNFFLSDRRDHYDHSYVGISSHAASGRLFAVARHDLSSQLNFTRNLVDAGRVEFDATGATVLNMTSCDYMRAMESVDWGGI